MNIIIHQFAQKVMADLEKGLRQVIVGKKFNSSNFLVSNSLQQVKVNHP